MIPKYRNFGAGLVPVAPMTDKIQDPGSAVWL
jgi:hypothetical protein